MAQELRVRALGGAELAVDGRPLVELSSAKATALLVYLAVTGSAHSRSALAGLLWSELPEEAARANLRLVLTKLRRVLPDHLAVTRQTVALAPGQPVWVDAVEVARVAGEDADSLPAAVELCRGDFLEGFEVPGAPLFDEWLSARRATYRSLMLAVMDRAVQRARDREDVEAGIDVARRLLELEPLHEEGHRALMWFLAKGGQRGAALAQFETCRYVLREELGVEPSPATLALRDEVARSGGFTELSTPEPGPVLVQDGDLPRPLTSLVGRERELARLRELFDDPACRLVTLVGPGGIGKTRLALEVVAARRVRPGAGGVVFVSFVGTVPTRPEEAVDLVVANLAAALGLSLAVPRDPLELLADHLAGRELLLVLDNLEQLRDAADVLAELLRRAPGVQFLVTSRRRLGLGVEWLVEVRGLPFPAREGDPDVAGYEAIRLFQERSRLVRPGADAEDVARVCRLLAGVPLAIELAARWVRSASPAAIADRLAGGLDLLATSAPDVERRHQSLSSVIDWSWQLLTDDERRVLARLSVLRGGFDLEAAVAVAGATLPLLAGLVDHSLVEVGEVGEDDRYGMHELLRQYAAGRLAAEPADEQATRERQAEHYAALLPSPASTLAGSGSELDTEVENLRAATDWLVRTADPARLDAYMTRLWPIYRRKGWFRETQAILTAALARDGIPVVVRARWHRLLGEADMQLGEMGRARDHFERTLSLLGSPVPTSSPGWLDMLMGQALQRGVRRLRPGGPAERRADRRGRAEERAAVSWQLMEAYWMLAERTAMMPIALWGLNQADRSSRLDLAAMNQLNFGMLLGSSTGLHRLADRHDREAVGAAEQAGDPFTITWMQVVGALHWLGVGDWATLDARLGPALEAGTGARLHRSVDQALLLGGVCRYLTGRFDEAAAMAAEGAAAGRERRDPMVHLWGLLVMTESRLRTDPSDPAIADWLDEAGLLLTRGVPRIDGVRAYVAAARFDLAAGRAADAWRAIRAAADLAGPEPSLAQYSLEAHAGIPEICFMLLEHRAPAGVEPDDLRATADAGLRRLLRFARAFPMARPRALACQGWSEWLQGHYDAARRAWVRSVREAERLAMPWELARAHDELGRHLAPGERSALGLDRAEHLAKARATFAALGCRTDQVAGGSARSGYRITRNG